MTKAKNNTLLCKNYKCKLCENNICGHLYGTRNCNRRLL